MLSWCLHFLCFPAVEPFFTRLIRSSSLLCRRRNLFLHPGISYTTEQLFKALGRADCRSASTYFLTESPPLQHQSHPSPQLVFWSILDQQDSKLYWTDTAQGRKDKKNKPKSPSNGDEIHLFSKLFHSSTVRSEFHSACLKQQPASVHVVIFKPVIRIAKYCPRITPSWTSAAPDWQKFRGNKIQTLILSVIKQKTSSDLYFTPNHRTWRPNFKRKMTVWQRNVFTNKAKGI